MRWTWDPNKERINKADHGLSFETAQLVFDDPLAASRPDPDDHTRWQTIGRVGQVTVLVIHTSPDDTEETGRIISARKATKHERKAYEEGDF